MSTDEEVEILMKYEKTFGEAFLFNLLPDDEQRDPIQVAKDCLERGRPYDRWIEFEEVIYP